MRKLSIWLPVVGSKVTNRPTRERGSEMTISNWIDYIRANAQRQEGQTMAEYGVVLALITLAVVGVITTLGTTIEGKIQGVVNVL